MAKKKKYLQQKNRNAVAYPKREKPDARKNLQRVLKRRSG
jgi:hypothetical protein